MVDAALAMKEEIEKELLYNIRDMLEYVKIETEEIYASVLLLTSRYGSY